MGRVAHTLSRPIGLQVEPFGLEKTGAVVNVPDMHRGRRVPRPDAKKPARFGPRRFDSPRISTDSRRPLRRRRWIGGRSAEAGHIDPLALGPGVERELGELNALGAFLEVPREGLVLDDVLEE